MDIQTHIDIFLSALGLIGTLLIGAGILKSAPEIRAEISMPKYGYNTFLVNNISGQKDDFEVGVSILTLAFLLKIASCFFVSSLSNLFLHHNLLIYLYSFILVAGFSAYATSIFSLN
jgi:hypothetical protein